jgi:hypothetical protein
MNDTQETRLCAEIEEIAAKINRTIKNIESVIPLHPAKGESADPADPGMEKSDPAQ